MVLKNGAIVEEGTHTHLLERQGEYATLWQAQLRDSEEDIEENAETSVETQPSNIGEGDDA